MLININNLIVETRKVKRIEKQIDLNNAFTRKWYITNNISP